MGGRLVKVLLVLVGIVLACEGYGRYVLKLKPGFRENELASALAAFVEFDPVKGVGYKLNVDRLIDSPFGDFQFLFKTNEIGVRDRPMGTHLRSELKFLMFGDEFVEGWGADIDQTFVVKAQNLVNEKTALKPPVRFVISGKSGYGAAQNYLAAPALIDELKPTAIVLFYTSLMPHADARFLADAATTDGLATGLRKEVTTLRVPHLEDYPPPPPLWLAAIAKQSVAARLAADWWSIRAMHSTITVGDAARDKLAGARATDLGAVHAPSLQHVLALAKLAEQREIPFLLVHFPLPPQVSADAWSGGRHLLKVADGLLPSDDAKVISSFCAENKLRCLSLHETLQTAGGDGQGARLFFPNELALTIEGAEVVAQWLADEVYRWLGDLGKR